MIDDHLGHAAFILTNQAALAHRAGRCSAQHSLPDCLTTYALKTLGPTKARCVHKTGSVCREDLFASTHGITTVAAGIWQIAITRSALFIEVTSVTHFDLTDKDAFT